MYGLLELVIFGSYVSDFYSDNGNSYKYVGKRNFYKRIKKNSCKIKSNETNKEKKSNQIKKTNISIKIKTNTNTNTNTNTSTGIKANNKITNYKITDYNKTNSDILRIMSAKLFIKKFLTNELIKMVNNNNEELISQLFVKFYKLFLEIIITYLDNNYKSIVDSNYISLVYLLELKNKLIEFKQIDKLIIFFNSRIKKYILTKLNINNNKIFFNEIIKTNCPITLEPINTVYCKCIGCGSTYSIEGIEYCKQLNNKCSIPWCTNLLSDMCLVINNIENIKNIENNNNFKNLNILINYHHCVEKINLI